jgi:hypothetical protein
MPLLSLNLQPPTAPETPASSEFLLNSTSVSLGLLPGRGLLYSLLFHEIAILVLLFSPAIRSSSHDSAPPKQWELTMIPKDVLYLPQLGGGSEGSGSGEAPGTGARSADSTPAPTSSLGGVSYPGLQAVVSNPPHPTNRIQTILQPAEVDPPVLKQFVPLPNILRLQEGPSSVAPGSPKFDAQSTAKPAPPAPAVNSALIAEQPVKLELPLEAPKLVLPTQAVSTPGPSLQSAPGPLEPYVEAAKQPSPKPQWPEAIPSAQGRFVTSLLTLSPTPALLAASVEIPPGEARGQFPITPLPNLAMANVGPGSVVGGGILDVLAVGPGSDPYSPDVTGGKVSGNGAGTNAAKGGGSSGIGSGAGATDSDAGGGSGTGRGFAVGSGKGHGLGAGLGSGSGGGAGPGVGVFPGITIQGGEWPARAVSGSGFRHAAVAQDEGSYGLTIVSTGNSGGGLKDFGVFYDEPVFTVYINTATSADDPAPAWTLQYAALKVAGISPDDLVPPFPVHKEIPEWPVELVTKYRGHLLVVYAVISTEGKMERVKMMQSPNIKFNEVLFPALDKWVFRPATVNGNPVAVKALLGVPIVQVR